MSRQRAGALLLTLAVAVSACGGTSTPSVEDHPSFPCYTWWFATSRVAGLAGVVPWASQFESVGVITYDELFEFVDEWVPDSDANARLNELAATTPGEGATDSERDVWEVSVVVAVYEWALFHLDLAREAIESATDIRAEDQQPLLDYVDSLTEWVEDQWALAVPLLDTNPRIDFNTLSVLTDNLASDRLFRAWRDVTEDSPFDTEAGIKDAAINVCGEDVYDIGT